MIPEDDEKREKCHKCKINNCKICNGTITNNTCILCDDYYFKPYEGGIFNDDEASIELVPRKIITQNRTQESSDSMSEGSNLNDIPE